jgi:hypothetical protein
MIAKLHSSWSAILDTDFPHPFRTNPVLLPAMSHRSSAAWLQAPTPWLGISDSNFDVQSENSSL